MHKIYQKRIIKIIILLIVLLITGVLFLFLNKQTINEQTDLSAEVAPQVKDVAEAIEEVQEQPETIEPSPTKTLFNVPFTSQAPYADWNNPRKQDGCEEASTLMAIYWAQGKTLTRYEANKIIEELSDWEKETYGGFYDTSAQDTVIRIIQGYWQHKNALVKNNVEIKDIIQALAQGNLVLTPANGQILGNPYFTQPGPETHMLVIIGYDPATDEFITNDPGTKRGAGYRYKTTVLFNAIRDYPTGDHEPIESIQKNIIIIGK